MGTFPYPWNVRIQNVCKPWKLSSTLKRMVAHDFITNIPIHPWYYWTPCVNKCHASTPFYEFFFYKNTPLQLGPNNLILKIERWTKNGHSKGNVKVSMKPFFGIGIPWSWILWPEGACKLCWCRESHAGLICGLVQPLLPQTTPAFCRFRGLYDG